MRYSLHSFLVGCALLGLSSSAFAISAPDFNGDGKSDLLWWKSSTGAVGVWLMNGTIAQSTAVVATVGADWQVAGIGDFNGDGKSDILWRKLSTGAVALWYMDSTTILSTAVIATVTSDWVVAGTGDINGDGQTDILWRKTSTGAVAVWFMNGIAIQSTAVIATVASDWVVAGTGDFDGDGKVDILWRKTSTGAVAVWYMNGSTIQSTAVISTVAADWVIAGTGDFNSDGKVDILWRKSSTGTVAVWFMNGSVIQSTAVLSTVVADWQIVGSGEPSGLGGPIFAANDAEAARFLIQATFGPTVTSIPEVRNAYTYAAWIDAQLALAPTYHLPYYRARAAEFMARSTGTDNGYYTPRQEAWWQNALTAPDQLRQRMAFALSEILVISQDGSLDSEHEGATAYYDILTRNAFGNYRQLLEEVTLSPMMGSYLSMIRNQKPSTSTGRQPDENYAREIMQLFTIGLSQLNTDGTLKLDSNGQPIPTYAQADIVGLAHVFTGWGPNFDPANPPHWNDGSVAKANDWFRYGWDPLRPMTFNTNYGDLMDRQIVGGVTVPGALTGPQRLSLALDTLFNHPNVGPFLARQLIQRFVTSNPSPAYIGRVAAVFNKNRTGVRGDLGATIRAVLLDPEARRPEFLTDIKYGKLTEPLLRMTRLFRAFPLTPPPYAGSGDNRLFLNFVYSMDEQSPLFSPTVFNFFKPGFSKAGPIADARLVSPEFQIYDDVTAMIEANRHNSLINSGVSVGEPVNVGTTMKLNYTEALAILTVTGRTNAESQAALVEYFNQRLLGGNMSPFLRQKILDTYTSLPASYSYSTANQLRRVQVGLYLVMFSPDFNIQR